MPKRITIAPHLSLEELEHRYRQAKEPVERSHYQIIWLLASGRRSEDVAEITGYSRSWIYELVWGYNRVGPETLGDGRVGNPGAAPILDDVQQANLWQALKGPAPDGGVWNGRKVADYLSELKSQPISRQQGWEYLKQMRMRLRVPRPSHSEADPNEQDAWKKKLQQQVERIQSEHPNAAVEVWSEDEHRIGLHPPKAAHLGGRGGTSGSCGQLETRVAVVVCVCPTPDWGNILVDFTLCQHQFI